MEADVAAAIQSIGMRINYDLVTQTVKELIRTLSMQNKVVAYLSFMPGVVEINRTLN